MKTTSLILRVVYAVCLAGATCVHLATHIHYGLLLGKLAAYGYSPATRYFWSSLTVLDPLAAVLLCVRPRIGLALAAAIIVGDVVHNSWLLHHFRMAPDGFYWAQVAFLVFLAATIRAAWRGSSCHAERA